jgi:hypothetical protein
VRAAEAEIGEAASSRIAHERLLSVDNATPLKVAIVSFFRIAWATILQTSARSGRIIAGIRGLALSNQGKRFFCLLVVLVLLVLFAHSSGKSLVMQEGGILWTCNRQGVPQGVIEISLDCS